jgi:hypothetical protein
MVRVNESGARLESLTLDDPRPQALRMNRPLTPDPSPSRGEGKKRARGTRQLDGGDIRSAEF